jgi:hypothetical protein
MIKPPPPKSKKTIIRGKYAMGAGLRFMFSPRIIISQGGMLRVLNFGENYRILI